jgi:hypothetical protein
MTAGDLPVHRTSTGSSFTVGPAPGPALEEALVPAPRESLGPALGPWSTSSVLKTRALFLKSSLIAMALAG